MAQRQHFRLRCHWQTHVLRIIKEPELDVVCGSHLELQVDFGNPRPVWSTQQVLVEPEIHSEHLCQTKQNNSKNLTSVQGPQSHTDHHSKAITYLYGQDGSPRNHWEALTGEGSSLPRGSVSCNIRSDHPQESNRWAVLRAQEVSSVLWEQLSTSCLQNFPLRQGWNEGPMVPTPLFSTNRSTDANTHGLAQKTMFEVGIARKYFV